MTQSDTLVMESREDTEVEDGEDAAVRAGVARGGGGWVFGAYAVLLIWGALYLFLFFADRLPG